MIMPTTADRERLMWLEALIESYEREHDWDGDEDSSATNDMLNSCRQMLAELLVKSPEPEPQVATTPPRDLGDEIPF